MTTADRREKARLRSERWRRAVIRSSRLKFASAPVAGLPGRLAKPSANCGDLASETMASKASFFGSKQRATAKDANGKAAIINTLGVLAL